MATYPNDPQIERAVIGDMLIDGSVAAQVAALLEPADFYNLKYQRLFCSLAERLASGRSLDGAVLVSQGVLSQNEYAGYIDCTPCSAAWRHHAQILREMRQRRSFVTAASQLVSVGCRSNSDVSAVLQSAWAELGCASRMTLAADTSPDRLLDGYVDKVQQWDSMPLARTGIANLDEATGGGILPGEVLALIGGDGSMKTSLALRVCDTYLSTVGHAVLYLSLDMQPGRISVRRLLPLAGCGEKRLVELIRRRDPLFAEWRAMRATADRGLFNIVGGPLTLKDIDSLLAQVNPGLVVWDFLTATQGYSSEMECQRACVERLRAWQTKYSAAWVILSQMSELSKAGQRQGDFAGRASGGNNLSRIADTQLELFLDEPHELSEYEQAAGVLPKPELIAIVTKCRFGQKGSAWSLEYHGPTMSFTGAAERVQREKKREPCFMKGRFK